MFPLAHLSNTLIYLWDKIAMANRISLITLTTWGCTALSGFLKQPLQNAALHPVILYCSPEWYKTHMQTHFDNWMCPIAASETSQIWLIWAQSTIGKIGVELHVTIKTMFLIINCILREKTFTFKAFGVLFYSEWLKGIYIVSVYFFLGIKSTTWNLQEHLKWICEKWT